MSPAFATFVFAFVAGFIDDPLGRNKRVRAWERQLLRPLGWVLMAASLSFALALPAWALVGHGAA